MFLKKDLFIFMSLMLSIGAMSCLGSSFVSVHSSPPLLLWGLAGLTVLGGGGSTVGMITRLLAENNERKVWYRDHRVTFCLIYFLAGCNTIYMTFSPIIPLSYVPKMVILAIGSGLVFVISVLTFVNYHRATKDSEEDVRKL